jgi:hypothetical protein
METDAGTDAAADGGEPDAGVTDAGELDAGSADAGEMDAGIESDAGETDAGSVIDAGPYACLLDAGLDDAGSNAGAPPYDAGNPSCLGDTCNDLGEGCCVGATCWNGTCEACPYGLPSDIVPCTTDDDCCPGTGYVCGSTGTCMACTGEGQTPPFSANGLYSCCGGLTYQSNTQTCEACPRDCGFDPGVGVTEIVCLCGQCQCPPDKPYLQFDNSNRPYCSTSPCSDICDGTATCNGATLQCDCPSDTTTCDAFTPGYNVVYCCPPTMTCGDGDSAGCLPTPG